MKLFLTSQAISSQQSPFLLQLVGEDRAEDVRIVLIENAADLYPEERRQFVDATRTDIQANGYQLDLLDLREYKQDHERLLARLQDANVIWLGGGNTYYLRWMLHETGADKMIQDLAEQGKIYGGGSAGAIVAGPTLHHYETADRPEDAPETIYDGLGLTDIAVLPHWDHVKYGKIMPGIRDALQADGYKTAHITDAQALIIDGDTHQIVP